MKPQGAHAHEDRLLDFAYGELPPSEARLVEQHVVGCSRCSETLDGIRGVRTTMSRLSHAPAPDAGLESLLAYAQQSARRAAAGPAPTSRWWRRLLAPALGVAAMSVFGVIVVQVNREVDLSPAMMKEAAQEPSTRGANKLESPPPPPPASPAPTAAPVVSAEAGKVHEQRDAEIREEMRNTPKPAKSAPKPVSRAVQPADWSNAGAGRADGFPDKKAVYGDEDASGLDVLGTPKSKRERGGIVRKSPPSKSTAGRLEPARDESPAAEEVAAGPAPREPIPGESQAAEYAPPSSPAQQIIGSVSLATSAPSKDAEADDYAKQAPGRAQAAYAEPPPPAPVAQYQQPTAAPSVGSYSAGASLQAESKNAGKKADVAQKPSEKGATRSSTSPAEFLKQASEARRSGDRVQEVELLRAALASGAQGAQRVEAYSKLCDAESALGNRQSALVACKQVMAMAPGSSEARMAKSRLERELRYSADEADSEPKAASPAVKE